MIDQLFVREGIKFTGDNADSILDWLIDRDFAGDAGGHGPDDGWNDDGQFWIDGEKCREVAFPGDFIVKVGERVGIWCADYVSGESILQIGGF